MKTYKRYAVIEVVEYYGCRLTASVAIAGDNAYTGTLEECQKCKAEIEAQPICLSHGQAGKYYLIGEVLPYLADYQTWLDSYVDWDDLLEDISDDDNASWAEQRAIKHRDIIYVPERMEGRHVVHDSILIDLDPYL